MRWRESERDRYTAFLNLKIIVAPILTRFSLPTMSRETSNFYIFCKIPYHVKTT